MILKLDDTGQAFELSEELLKQFEDCSNRFKKNPNIKDIHVNINGVSHWDFEIFKSIALFESENPEFMKKKAAGEEQVINRGCSIEFFTID